MQDPNQLRLQEDAFATSEADYQMMLDPEGDLSVRRGARRRGQRCDRRGETR